MRKFVTKVRRFFFEFGVLQKRVNLVDLVKSCQIRFQYLLAKISFDTAENGPLKVCKTLAKS